MKASLVRCDAGVTGFSSAVAGSQHPRVLFYCQSSLGIGHTMRSLRLIDGMRTRFDVTWLHGGSPIPGIHCPLGVKVIQLPPIVADEEFSHLVAEHEGLSIEQTLAQRAQIMMETCRRFCPRILVIELFPFGRRRFSSEILPLIKMAKKKGAIVVCSLRDLLVPRRDHETHEARVVELVNRLFDAVLIHGDPSLFRLEETFSRAADLRVKVMYTGYVAPDTLPHDGIETDPAIVVSLGGGRFGYELARGIVAAAPRLAHHFPHRIELYTGPFCPAEEVSSWFTGREQSPNLTIKTFTTDFINRLGRADLAISLGGYNTTMDVLVSGVRALMYPCSNNLGMDQVIRLKRLAERGWIELLSSHDLTTQNIVDRVRAALDRKPLRIKLDLSGVETTCEVLSRIFNESAAERV